jgi:glycosyltransferase involved in cell wall biosynthesis
LKIIKMSVPFFNIVSTNNRIANVLSDNFRTGKVWVVEFGVHKCVNRPPIRERNEILAVAKWREGRKPEIYIEIAKKLGKEYKFIIAGHWDDKDYPIEDKK